MKNQFNLTIPKACSEKWSSFTPTEQGGFCSSCNKEVIDFTTMSDQEIIDFFQRRPSHTCGRFRPDQLKNYTITLTPGIYPGFKLFHASIISLFLLMVNNAQAAVEYKLPKSETTFVQPISHQQQVGSVKGDHIIKGYVKSEDGEPIAGVNIYLKDSQEGTVSDVNGYFEFPGKLKTGDVLYFSFIGFETEEYVVSETNEVNIEMRLTMRYQLLGEVAIDGPSVQNDTFVHRIWSAFKNLF